MTVDKDERIRLLEYQIAFLHRELTLVTRRHESIAYSATWTLARPVKRIEDALHGTIARLRRRKTVSVGTDVSAAPIDTQSVDLTERIAMRIARRMTQQPARE